MNVTKLKALRTAVIATIVAALPLAAGAQSYKSLWKKVDKACEQELPKTALRYLDDIVNLPQNDHTQQLKALITRMSIANEISEDSASAMLPRIEAAAQAQTGDADKSLWNMVLGWLYAQQNSRIYPQSSAKALAALRSVTTDAKVLAAASSQKYLPVLRKGDDSRYYGHDMLSVVFPFAARQLSDMHTAAADSLSRDVMGREIKYYRTAGNRPATLLAKLDSVDIVGSANKQIYQQLIEEFGDCQLASEVYARLAEMSSDSTAHRLATTALEKYPSASAANRLKNIVANATRPAIECALEKNLVRPGDEVTAAIRHCNTASATLSCTRLPYKASDSKLDKLTDKDYDKLSQSPDFSTRLTFGQRQPYETVTDSTRIKLQKSGVYLVKLDSPDTEPCYQIMHVSALSVIQLPLPDRKTRICVADNANGKPVANAKISIRTMVKNTPTWQEYVCDDKGEVTIDTPKSTYSEVFASAADDDALPARRLAVSYGLNWNLCNKDTEAKIYTDRAIYRPGQTVRAGGFVYRQEGDSTHALGGTPLTLELYNTNNKLTGSASVTTDEFGSFGAEFVLPQECLNGRFHIRCEHGSTSFRVEEYKRPTFKISLSQPTTAYAPGDTVMVEGEVASVSGRPMGGTTVYCRTVRTRSYWLRASGGDTRTTRRDTVVSDADGKFVIPVVLTRPEGDGESEARFYTYTVDVKATADDGETQDNTLRIFAGSTRVAVSANVPDVMCKEQMPELTATQSNAMGQAVGGKGRAAVTQGSDTLLTATIDFNKKGQFGFVKTLKSGEYTIVIVPEGETDSKVCYKKTFTLLSLCDTKPAGNAPLQVWSSSNRFENGGEAVHVIAGSPLSDTWLRYDLVANGKVVDSRLMHLSDTVMRFDYIYKEDYGNGMHAQFALLDNGTLHRESVVIKKPLPNKSLDIRWSTFRNKLTPGAEETWVMHVSKDSVPVKASVLATMYDASLNKFGAHSLPFALSFNRTVPMQYWNHTNPYSLSLSASKQLEMLKEHDLEFTVPDPTLFSLYRPLGMVQYSLKPRMAKARMLNTVMLASNVEAETEEVQLDGQTAAAGATEADPFDQVEVRTDFNETAFFAPSLKTDSQGNATIEFKLPESITSWNFHALAHTKNLDYAAIDTTISVEKPFAVYANIPRFVRNSDKTVLSVNVVNNTDAKQTGKLRLTLTDPQTGKKAAQTTQPFSVAPKGNTAVGFSVTVPDDATLLICHVAGISQDFTDAEQHAIPVLTNTSHQITTVPFTVSDSASHTVSLEGLGYNGEAGNSALTLEYIANPVWTLLTAMPATVDHTSHCATTLAANYASLATVRTMLKRYPQIRSHISSWMAANTLSDSPLAALENNAELKNIILAESPWENDAVSERQRLSALTQSDGEMNLKLASMLDKLKELQTADGGWQWYPGMSANLGLTLQVTETLMRADTTDSQHSDKIADMTGKALKYLERKAKEMVANLKKADAKVLPTDCIDYLHVMAMANRTDNAECKYLLSHLRKYSAHYDLYHKAVAASVLAATDHRKEAQALVSSLMEHTVSTQASGRYFDSHKAPRSWSMYRIPTQLRTIETLRQACPDSTAAIAEMEQWLLMNKHAQAWTNPLVAAQAIEQLAATWQLDSALVLPAAISLSTDKGSTLNLLDYATCNTLAPMGYVKATIPMDKISGKPVALKIGDTGSTVSYGAVYLDSKLHASQTKATGSDISLRMTLYKETATGWTELTAQTALSKGDRVKAHYTLQTSRDLDFVSVKTPRAACMEPVSTASGYRHGCYVAVEDASTTYFYDKLAKGTIVLEEVFSIDRQGTFCVAPAQAQCQYAPEFVSTTPATTVYVK